MSTIKTASGATIETHGTHPLIGSILDIAISAFGGVAEEEQK
jgi:hypothetical protein